MKKVSISELKHYHDYLVDKIEKAMREPRRDDYKGSEIVEIMVVIGMLDSIVKLLANDRGHIIKAVEIDDDRIQAAIDINPGNNHYLELMAVGDVNYRKLIALLKKHKICSLCEGRGRHKKGCCLSHMKL